MANYQNLLIFNRLIFYNTYLVFGIHPCIHGNFWMELIKTFSKKEFTGKNCISVTVLTNNESTEALHFSPQPTE